MCTINIWAVIVSAVAATIIGYLWYSPALFGKVWMREMNITMPSDAERKGMWVTILGQLLACFISLFVLARLIELSASTTIAGGIAVALLIWVGFIAMIGLQGIFWERKSWAYFGITTGYHLVSLIVAALIISAWQ